MDGVSSATATTGIAATLKAAATRAADGDYKASGPGHRVKDADGDYKPTPQVSASGGASPSGATMNAITQLTKGG